MKLSEKGEVMKFIISEHIYIYGFTHLRLCCMFVLGYAVLS